MKTPWFASWFDSPYYHLLYGHRDDLEAEFFIDNLYSNLHIKPADKILDLACGAGRHALYMASNGNNVTGIDLSSNSIHEAKIKAIERGISNHVDFSVQDMRNFELNAQFDFVFNLFTSFGYFDSKAENEDVLLCAKRHLNPHGTLVIDYLNSELVRANGEESYTKSISGIEFKIHKYFEGDFVMKEIEVNDQGSTIHFREQVQLFAPNELETLLKKSGFEVIEHFGDYALNNYTSHSTRSILISHLI